jgi:hypothetical protein
MDDLHFVDRRDGLPLQCATPTTGLPTTHILSDFLLALRETRRTCDE